MFVRIQCIAGPSIAEKNGLSSKCTRAKKVYDKHCIPFAPATTFYVQRATRHKFGWFGGCMQKINLLLPYIFCWQLLCSKQNNVSYCVQKWYERKKMGTGSPVDVYSDTLSCKKHKNTRENPLKISIWLSCLLGLFFKALLPHLANTLHFFFFFLLLFLLLSARVCIKF